MKTKIAEALKTKYKSFGLSNEAFDRIASAKEKTVTKEEDIEAGIADYETMDLIAKELQKMRDSEIQKRTDLQREHDDYKAKHPDKDPDPDPDPDPNAKPDIAKIVEAAVAAAVKPIKDDLDTYKSQNSAKEAIASARNAFFGDKWTTKFQDEANDAWDRATELNEAGGGKMTSEELAGKAKEYFTKAVQRKGTDVSKPFEEGNDPDKNKPDFSALANRLADEGKIPAAEE